MLSLTLQSGYMRGASTPVLGAAHATDLPEFFGMGNQTDFIAVDSISKYGHSNSEIGVTEQVAVYFTNKCNPNAPRDSISPLRNITWEKWSSCEEKPSLLTFVDPVPSMTITSDTYRSEPIKLIIELSMK